METGRRQQSWSCLTRKGDCENYLLTIIDWNLVQQQKFLALEEEVLNEISFTKFLKQVDGKNWRLHLLLSQGML